LNGDISGVNNNDGVAGSVDKASESSAVRRSGREDDGAVAVSGFDEGHVIHVISGECDGEAISRVELLDEVVPVVSEPSFKLESGRSVWKRVVGNGNGDTASNVLDEDGVSDINFSRVDGDSNTSARNLNAVDFSAQDVVISNGWVNCAVNEVPVRLGAWSALVSGTRGGTDEGDVEGTEIDVTTVEEIAEFIVDLNGDLDANVGLERKISAESEVHEGVNSRSKGWGDGVRVDHWVLEHWGGDQVSTSVSSINTVLNAVSGLRVDEG
jgi:hypothetical protein